MPIQRYLGKTFGVVLTPPPGIRRVKQFFNRTGALYLVQVMGQLIKWVQCKLDIAGNCIIS